MRALKLFEISDIIKKCSLPNCQEIRGARQYIANRGNENVPPYTHIEASSP